MNLKQTTIVAALDAIAFNGIVIAPVDSKRHG
ncbi:hypothetical protein ABH944_003421 [Caballeronia udeis]|jgi:hypothetical protein|uniref:Uncharacterized protein n=1 Tax=Caballeronia udeis TaxID=1232866 RepID=A0ABW8MP30_9BURK